MDDQAVTPREFDLLRQMVQDGFEGTHARLDAIDKKQEIANGRTNTLEKDGRGILERLVAVERDVKRLVMRRVRAMDIERHGITRRDLKVAGLMLAAGGALVEYGPKVLKALQVIGSTP